MRFRRNVQYEFGLKTIHLVAFLSVAFLLVLLFFFPCGFITPLGLAVNLPRSFTGQGFAPGKTIEITINEQGGSFIDGRPAGTQMLKELLLAEGRGSQVLIKAHKRAPLDAVTGLWNLCREAGIVGVSLLSNE